MHAYQHITDKNNFEKPVACQPQDTPGLITNMLYAYMYIITNVYYAIYHIYYTGLSPSFIQALLPLKILTSGCLHDWWYLSPGLLCSILLPIMLLSNAQKISYHAQYYAHDYCKYVTVYI